MADKERIASPGCSKRRTFLGPEHDAWTLIRDAETPGSIPIEQLVNFQLCQRARWAHEDACAKCVADIGEAA